MNLLSLKSIVLCYNCAVPIRLFRFRERQATIDFRLNLTFFPLKPSLKATLCTSTDSSLKSVLHPIQLNLDKGRDAYLQGISRKVLSPRHGAEEKYITVWGMYKRTKFF